jgi:hypothetical protein
MVEKLSENSQFVMPVLDAGIHVEGRRGRQN